MTQQFPCPCCTKERIVEVLSNLDLAGKGALRIPVEGLDVAFTYCPSSLRQVLYMKDRSTGVISSAHAYWEVAE